jgi:integrase
MLDFLAYLELERGLSRNTLQAYRSDLLQFGSSRPPRAERAARPATAISRRSCPSWPARPRPPVAATTRQRKVACLRSFYRHLRREGTIEHDPTAELRGPRKSQRLPRVLSRDEVARLLSEPRGTDPCALRDRALLEVMYACGLRARRRSGSSLQGRRSRGGVLCARGKGSKERLVPIGRRAVESGAARVRPAWAPAGRPRGASPGDRGAAVRQSPRLGPHAPGPVQDRPGSRARRRPRAEDEPAHAAPHASPRTCSPAAATCARCRRCSATQTSRRPRSTPICRPSGSRTPTSAPIRGRSNDQNVRKPFR